MDNDPPHNRFEEEKKPLVANKLKIKLEDFHRGIVHGDDDKEARDWICKVCSKKFSSCKALGGHMRVHSENFAVDGVASDDFSRKSKYRMLERDGKPTCLLCNKSFNSLQSLFGHMRCHPERDWRGMIPPENSQASTISSEQKVLPSYENDEEMIDCSSSGVDLLACLSDGWPVRRRRSGENAEIDTSKSMLDENEYEAIDGLMLLANCYKSNDLDEDEETFDDYDLKDESAVKKRKLSLEDATTSSMVKCSKVFSTPQALGGDKSSGHPKILISADVLMVEADDAMRRHYDQGPADAGEAQLSLATCDHQSTDEPRFDLNELPAV